MNKFKVDVLLADKPGAGAGQSKGKVEKLDGQSKDLETHKIGWLHGGDTVEWVFSNNSQTEVMRVGIGNFRTPPRLLSTFGGQNVENPFDGGCSKTVVVQPGSSGVLSCRVKRNTYRPRTYKYDIIDKSENQVMLDPEIEIV